MKDGFDTEQGLSQVDPQTSESGLTPRQTKIYRNLQDIGPEIAAFYRDGVRMLRSDDFETAPYLLAHITREIDGGLRDILSSDEAKAKIQKQLTKEILAQIGDYDTLKEYRGHIASILVALGIDNIDILSNPDDASICFAIRWLEVTGNFSKFAHRHGAWKSPRSREAFEHLWYDFEEVLADLVGSYLNLLNRLDRILAYKAPTEEIIETLPNLLQSDARRAYFFRGLKYPTWLKPLKDADWFNPENNPLPYDVPDNPGYYHTPVWYALEYLEKIANHPERDIDLLAKIVDAIVNHTDDTTKSIENYHTNRRLIVIIGTFPIDRIESKHITFMSTALKSSRGWVIREIGETILPKFIREGKNELTLDLLKVMFDTKVVNRQIQPVMEDYWLKEAIKQQEQAISELCGFDAAQITLGQIRTLVDEGAYSFDFIERIGTESAYGPQQRYAELLVSFTCRLFHLASPNTIAETVKSLLKEGVAVNCNHQDAKGSPTIFGRIALNVITHHYDHLKQLFWEWEGNPLEEYELKFELYQLIQTHCFNFDKSEIEQILSWIESREYIVMFAEDDETRAKVVAYQKRQWLSALLETGNEKVITACRKYEQINPAEIEPPGHFTQIPSGAISQEAAESLITDLENNDEMEVPSGKISRITAKELSDMSNAEIAQYLNDFQEAEDRADSTSRRLETVLPAYVAANPQRFTEDLQPFHGVHYQHQHSILSGLRNAWCDKREFDWSTLLEFIYQILSSEQFWAECFKEHYNYRNWILFTTVDLVSEGTSDDKHAFDAQLLPIAEKILMILIEKAEPSVSIFEDLRFGVLNSLRGKVFSAMVRYALRHARINNPKQGLRWPQAIRRDFTKRLDRSVEFSLEFSFTLGSYLPNLLYLDKEWVVDNIDRIFPQQDKSHWEAAFSGYLFRYRIFKYYYSLFKKRGDYQKALNTDFTDKEVLGRLIRHVCTGWIEDLETFNDKNSLIYQLINSNNPKLLSEMVQFFWRQRNNPSDKIKSKVKPTWRALIEVLDLNSSEAEYQEILGSLSGWLGLIDKIDEEILEWLKLSAKYVERGFNSASFVEALREHVPQTPKAVGEIYLEMLTNKVYPDYPPTDIQETIRILYHQGYKEDADEICNLYAAAGPDAKVVSDVLRPLWEEYQN